jgi:hypothetical protein
MLSEIHLCDLYFLELNVFSIDTPLVKCTGNPRVCNKIVKNCYAIPK